MLFLNKRGIESFLEEGHNYYSLIIAISKIARSIVDLANDVSGTCPDNPVQEAIDSLNSSECEIIEPKMS